MSKYISDGGILDFEHESYLSEDRSAIEYDDMVIAQLNDYMTERGFNTYEQRREYVINLLNGNEEPPQDIFNTNRRGVADGFSLKHESAFVMGEDGNIIYGAHGDEHSVSLTRGVPKGSTVMHNHPSGSYLKAGEMGGTFSMQDVRVISHSEGAEIVAVGMEGTYSLKCDEYSDRAGYSRRVSQDAPAVQKRIERAHNKCVERKQKGYYRSKSQFFVDNNNSQLEVVHKYYDKSAKEYGMKYSFTPNKSVSAKAAIASQKRMATKPDTGKGSKTKVRGAYKDSTGQTYIAYKTNGKEYITDGTKKITGEERRKKIASSTYVGTMSSKTFSDWKEGKKTRELGRKRKEGIGARRGKRN